MLSIRGTIGDLKVDIVVSGDPEQIAATVPAVMDALVQHNDAIQKAADRLVKKASS